jgi:hypothetical protein
MACTAFRTRFWITWPIWPSSAWTGHRLDIFAERA